jgi:hypothetical protein
MIVPVGVYNLGYRSADSVVLNVFVYDQQNTLQPLFNVPVGSIVVESSSAVQVSVPTESLSKHVTLELQVKDLATSGDIVPENNTVSCTFSVSGAPQATIDFFVNQLPAMDGDYIGATPTIGIRSRCQVAATSLLLFADGVSIPPTGTVSPGTGIALFEPNLRLGRHQLRAVVVLGQDSVSRVIDVQVSDETKILNLFNYPNPFARSTEVTFELTSRPEQVILRIFTLAGRKIRQMELSAAQVEVGPGRFMIPWDGRDQDGDDIANGVYFYQIQVSAAGKTASTIGKMVRIR